MGGGWFWVWPTAPIGRPAFGGVGRAALGRVTRRRCDTVDTAQYSTKRKDYRPLESHRYHTMTTSCIRCRSCSCSGGNVTELVGPLLESLGRPRFHSWFVGATRQAISERGDTRICKAYTSRTSTSSNACKLALEIFPVCAHLVDGARSDQFGDGCTVRTEAVQALDEQLLLSQAPLVARLLAWNHTWRRGCRVTHRARQSHGTGVRATRTTRHRQVELVDWFHVLCW